MDERMVMGAEILDPFISSGTTAQAAEQEGRRWIGIDLDPRNEALVRERVEKVGGSIEVVAMEARGDEVTVGSVNPLPAGGKAESVPFGTTASTMEPDPPAPAPSGVVPPPASPTPRPSGVVESDYVEVG